MAKLWSDWYPDVLVHVPGAPLPLVDMALVRSAREFFGRTFAWMEWLAPVTTTAVPSVGTNLYGFVLPADTEIVKLKRATVDGTDYAVERFESAQADPVYFANAQSPALVSQDLVSYRLIGDLTTGRKVQVLACLQPTLAAANVPDYLFNRHHMAIAEGAKKILMMTPGVFFNAELAGVANQAFNQAIDTAHAQAYMGKTSTTPRMNPHWC